MTASLKAVIALLKRSESAVLGKVLEDRHAERFVSRGLAGRDRVHGVGVNAQVKRVRKSQSSMLGPTRERQIAGAPRRGVVGELPGRGLHEHPRAPDSARRIR